MEEQAAEAEFSAALAALNAPAEAAPAEEAQEEAQAESPVEVAEEAPVETPAEEAAEADESAEQEMTQREKSWQGRLEKREAELKAREEALAANDTAQEADPKAPGNENLSMVEQIRQQASALMSGDDFETRIQEAAEEYGPEFLTLAAALGAAMYDPMAKKTVEQIDGRFNDLTGAIQNEFRSAHIDRIAQDHPDFAELVDSDSFQEWLGAMPDEERTKAESLLKTGRARPIAKLLTRYKDAMSRSDDVDDDAAVGVRSSAPVKIPSRPAMNDEEEFSAALKRIM